MFYLEKCRQFLHRRLGLQHAASPSRVFMARAAMAFLALICCIALSSPSVAQAPMPSPTGNPLLDSAARSEKKYVLEWMVAGSGAAVLIFLVIRSANRAEQPKEEIDLVLREPMH